MLGRVSLVNTELTGGGEASPAVGLCDGRGGRTVLRLKTRLLGTQGRAKPGQCSCPGSEVPFPSTTSEAPWRDTGQAPLHITGTQQDRFAKHEMKTAAHRGRAQAAGAWQPHCHLALNHLTSYPVRSPPVP